MIEVTEQEKAEARLLFEEISAMVAMLKARGDTDMVAPLDLVAESCRIINHCFQNHPQEA